MIDISFKDCSDDPGSRSGLTAFEGAMRLSGSPAIYPTAGLFAAANALESVYQDHVDGRQVETPLYAFDDFTQMIGFQNIRDFEKKYADLLAV
jgi:2,3-dimethylmalate lyase